MPTNDVDFFLMGEMEEKKKYRNYVTSWRRYPGPLRAHDQKRAGFACDLGARDLGQELRHMYHENQMHHRFWPRLQPALPARAPGLGIGTSILARYISSEKIPSSPAPATRGM